MFHLLNRKVKQKQINCGLFFVSFDYAGLHWPENLNLISKKIRRPTKYILYKYVTKTIWKVNGKPLKVIA